MQMRRLLWGMTAFIVFAGAAFSHHGASAYDRGNRITLKATITEFKWTNPHVYILFDAPDQKGSTDHWSCESINPGMLSKQGWSRRTLNAGDKVTIIGFPSKTGSKVMLLEKLILADGKELAPSLLD
jgi:Family of unknown function (DUF6152)